MKNLTDIPGENAKWFLFPWFPERGPRHIHPEDLAVVRREGPFGHVLEHLDTSEGWYRLRYSGGIIHVRPDLLRPVAAPDFHYSARVSTVAPRSPVSGTIQTITWHHRDSAHLFYLSVQGKPFKTRYRANELQLLT